MCETTKRVGRFSAVYHDERLHDVLRARTRAALGLDVGWVRLREDSRRERAQGTTQLHNVI
jgi:hypothetical protein